ncbi:MAG: membrane protein insertion efficiency factor YidD [Pseudonocardiales bacterium]|nr:membrane protein insertion efficiency factor YidD [Pseudonocardiales bacterium]
MRRTSPFAAPAILLIRWYQRWVSPGLPPRCRFYPTCSAYAIESLRVHGLVVGSALALWRLLRCAPWHPGGVDPVPLRRFRLGRPADDSAEDRAETRAEARATEERAPC